MVKAIGPGNQRSSIGVKLGMILLRRIGASAAGHTVGTKRTAEQFNKYVPFGIRRLVARYAGVERFHISAGLAENVCGQTGCAVTFRKGDISAPDNAAAGHVKSSRPCHAHAQKPVSSAFSHIKRAAGNPHRSAPSVILTEIDGNASSLMIGLCPSAGLFENRFRSPVDGQNGLATAAFSPEFKR